MNGLIYLFFAFIFKYQDDQGNYMWCFMKSVSLVMLCANFVVKIKPGISR